MQIRQKVQVQAASSKITPEHKMFGFNSVCKKMKMKFIDGNEFAKSKEEQWPKHKQKEEKKDK